MIVKVLTAIVLSDMNDFEFDSDKQEETWKSIEEQNHFRKKMEKALKEILYIGDGAFKVTIDTAVSEYPILEWYPGERIEIIYQRDRVHEVIFKTPYDVKGRRYVLNERYGYGYIINELYLDEKLVDLKVLEQTRDLTDWQFGRKIILAVQCMCMSLQNMKDVAAPFTMGNWTVLTRLMKCGPSGWMRFGQAGQERMCRTAWYPKTR